MPQILTTLPDGKICDFIDQKIRKDTPEEYVRQNIERRLVLELGYSPKQIAVEFPIQAFSKRGRADLVIFPEDQEHIQDNARIVIECKRDSVEPSDRRDGVDQLKSYMNASNAEWGMWTNGKHKAVFRRVICEGHVIWEEPNDIPSKDGDIEEVDRPHRELLKHATDDNLLFSFKICHNKIDAASEVPAVKEFSYDPEARPIWEIVMEIGAEIPDEEWAKVPTDLSKNFDYYQTRKDDR